MQLLEHFKELTLHPKNAEELKGLILQLAVQGKLTKKWREENPDVESAEVLLEKIKAEKELSSKAGKNKKEKQLPVILLDDTPFELPQKWVWCRLGEIIKISSGNGLTSANMDKNGKIPVYGGNGKTGFHNVGNVNERTIVIGRVGYYCGSIHLTEESAWVTDNAFITTFSNHNIERDFLVWLLKATNLKEDENATAQPVISGRKVYPIIISLPPLAEQKAIVETVNQLFAEVEQLEALTKERIQLKADFVTSALNQLTQAAEQDTASQWDFLKSQFGTFFTEKENIKKLREAFLQLAVQGKLTHHWRAAGRLSGVEVESASELLEKIKAEKAELIKKGKIKKEKQLPSISEDEIPYELPEGWVWCRLGEIIKEKPRNGYSPKGVDHITQTKSLKLGATTRGFFNSNEVKYLEEEISMDSYLWLKPNDILIQRSNSIDYVGVSAIYNGVEYDFVYPDLMMKIRVCAPISPIYLHTILSSQLIRGYFRSNASGTSGNMPKINQEIVINTLIPITNETEQKAIVEKVNVLMALCDKLEQEIETHQTTQEQWIQSCLREVVEF